MKQILTQTIIDEAKRLLDGFIYDYEFVAKMKSKFREEGFHMGDSEIEDITSRERLLAVYNVNTQLKSKHRNWKIRISEDVLSMYPAMEVYLNKHEPQRITKKSLIEKWTLLGGRIFKKNRMIALKSDEIWEKFSLFGLPYPPYDIDCLVWSEDVDYMDAKKLGVFRNESDILPIDKHYKEPEFTFLEEYI